MKATIKLRRFQASAVRRCLAHLAAGRSVCLVSPTGSGKTVMAQAIASRFPQTLTIVHTRALLKQAQRRLGRAHTIQQLLRSGLPATARAPGLLIWDECHHSASDEWRKLIELFPASRVLGLTATPQRSDGRGLEVFDRMVVAAQYSELVKAGVLVGCRVFVPDAKVDGSEPDPVHAYRKYARARRALFFVRSIEHADACAKRLGKGFAAWHHGVPWGKRSELLKAFRELKLRGLVTVEALTEGFDVPSVETIVLARRCQHVGTFLQIVGRGLRIAPGKVELTLLDLCNASSRHGSPVADRDYTISGAGISDARHSEAIDRDSTEYEPLGQHDARLVEVRDWSRFTTADKADAMARLERLARQRGYDARAVKEAARRLFE